MKSKTAIYTFIILLLSVLILKPAVVLADPASNNYQLRNYSFGSGGQESATSSNYSVYSIAGEQSGESATSNNYKTQPGLIFVNQANLPPAPAFSNPGSTYNRLKFVINSANNPSDAKFAIAITDDNWVTTNFIKSDYTVGSTLTSQDWLTYTGWGGEHRVNMLRD